MAADTLEQPATEQPINPMSSAFSTPEFKSSIANLFPDEPPDEAIAAPTTKPPEPPPTPAPAKAPAKAEPPKVETKSDDAIPELPESEIPAEIKSPKARDNFKKQHHAKVLAERERDKFKADYQKAFDDLKAARGEIDTFKSAAPKELNLAENPEYQRLKAEAEEYSKRIQQLEVRKHPKFEEHFNGRINAQMEIAKRVGGDKAAAILKLPAGEYRDEKLEELAAELTPVKAAQVAGVASRLDEINAEMEAEITKATENYKVIKEQQAQSERATQSTRESAFKNILAAASENELFKPKEGDEAWNKGVQERIALAEKIYNGKMKPEEAAHAALRLAEPLGRLLLGAVVDNACDHTCVIDQLP